MNVQQIQQIIANRAFPGSALGVEMVETHISWVLLTTDYAFKIKKPLKYPFLDFSTLEKRHYYCERELKLNRRLVKDMYLRVLPIRKAGDRLVIGGRNGRIIDYAVQMKRQDNTRQMNLLLEAGEVKTRDMEDLAQQLAAFHARTEVIRDPLDRQAMQDDFADLAKVQPFVAIHLGEKAAGVIADAVEYSDFFLSQHEGRLQERIDLGFTIDGHGDLHSKNILLPQDGPAIIFDCIEFSDHFRRVDVLNELAFFCMDLDFYDHPELGIAFLNAYTTQYPVLLTPEDALIFHYYKLYRANVRVKINALKTMQSPDDQEMKERMKLVRAYLSLLKKYLASMRVDVLEDTD